MRTYVKIFKDDNKLREMLSLRQNGWTLKSLAIIYGVDHSSIYKWCILKKVKKPLVTISLNLPSIISETGLIPKRTRLKMYEDYLNDERNKHSILSKL